MGIDEFLQKFALFGIGIVVLVPFIVGAVKKVYLLIKKTEMPSIGVVITVFLASWFCLALSGVLKFWPQYEDVVTYILAAVLLPLSSIGLYSSYKSISTPKQ